MVEILWKILYLFIVSRPYFYIYMFLKWTLLIEQSPVRLGGGVAPTNIQGAFPFQIEHENI